jgi:hypothetical protein
MISAEFIKERQLIIEIYSGEVSVDDFIELKNAEFSHEAYTTDIRLLADIRFSSYLNQDKDLEIMQNFIDLNIGKLSQNYLAFLISSTKQLFEFQGLMLIKKVLKTDRVNVFTNRQVALDWLASTNII